MKIQTINDEHPNESEHYKARVETACNAVTVSGPLRNVLYYIKHDQIYALQALSFAVVLADTLYEPYVALSSADHNYAYISARCAGASLKLCAHSVLIPVARLSYTTILNSSWGRYLGLRHPITDHKIFATLIIAFSAMHIVAHYINNPNCFNSWTGVTGLVMSAALIVTAGVILAENRLKKYCPISYGAVVLRTHQIGATVFLGTFLIHTPDYRLLNSMLFFSLFLGDRLIEKLAFKYETEMSVMRILNTDFYRVYINKPENFTSLPGQWLAIRCKAIDGKMEKAHPFTIANFPHNNTIELVFRPVGVWTNNLAKLAGLINPTQIEVIGPFGPGLTSDIWNKKPTSVICAGAGASLATAILDYMNFNNKRTNMDCFHISQRTVAEFTPALEAIKRAASKNNFSVCLYLTGENSKKQLPMLQQKIAADNLYGTVTCIFSERPNYKRIVNETERVLVCANPKICKEVTKLATQNSKFVHCDGF